MRAQDGGETTGDEQDRLPTRRRALAVTSASVVTILSIALAGCSKQPADYCPLTQGLYWTYEIQYPLSGPTQKPGKLEAKVDGEEIVDGKRYTRILNLTEGMEIPVGLYRRAAEGVYIRSGAHREEGESLLWPEPPVIGKSWRIKINGSNFEYRILTQEEMEIPGRKFDHSYTISVVWDTPQGKSFGYEYRAPGIGLVRKIVNSNGVTADYLLDAYGSR